MRTVPETSSGSTHRLSLKGNWGFEIKRLGSQFTITWTFGTTHPSSNYTDFHGFKNTPNRFENVSITLS
jgi:hypothetical protein